MSLAEGSMMANEASKMADEASMMADEGVLNHRVFLS